MDRRHEQRGTQGQRLAHARWRTATLAPRRPDRPAAPRQVRADGPGLPPLRRHADHRPLAGRRPAPRGRRPRRRAAAASPGASSAARSDALAVGHRRDAYAGGPAGPDGRDPVPQPPRLRRRARPPPPSSARTRCCSTPASPGRSSADVVAREKAELVIYDEEFAGLVEHARTEVGGPARAGRVAGPSPAASDADRRAESSRRTVGAVARQAGALRQGHPADLRHHGTPKGARPRRPTAAPTRWPRCSTGSRGGPRRHVVVAAPMFHAWGFGQLVDRRDADLHGRHPAQVRPRGDAGDGARARRHRARRRAGDDRADHGAARPRCSTATRSRAAAVRHRQRVADARRRGASSFMDRFGDVDLQQLQRHRGRADHHRGAGRPAGRARHRGQAGRRHRAADPRRRRPRGAAGRGRPDHGAQRLPVRRLHLGRHQDVPRATTWSPATSAGSTRPGGSTSSAATTR